MDIVKPVFLFAGVIIAQSDFLRGVADFLAASDLPHTSAALGEALGRALVPLVSGVLLALWQKRSNAKVIARQVRTQLAHHLATLAGQESASESSPTS